LCAHIEEGGLHVISGIPHRGGAVGQTRVFKTFQGGGKETGNDRLRLAALGDLCGCWSGNGSGLVAFMLTGSGACDTYSSSEAEAQKKDASIHHLLPADTC
jgi:hypothetical protein